MKPLLCSFLLIDEDPAWRSHTAQLFNKLAQENKTRFGVEFRIIETSTGAEAVQWVATNGDLQGILLDWQLFNPQTGEEQAISEEKLLDSIRAIRPELPLYILTSERLGYEIMDETEGVEAFFLKENLENDPLGVLERLVSDFNLRRATPFWSAFRQYVVGSMDSWHTPGHSAGASFRNSPYLRDFHDFWGRNTFAADLSVSVESLGSLLDSTFAVGKAQQEAARTFGTRKTFFVTNGSSTSNKIILQAIVRPGDKVVIDRNCHKSVHYGVVLSGALPRYLNSDFDNRLGIFAPPSLAEIEEKLQEEGIKVIVLTGCTYDGLLIDVSKVVAMAHARGVKVFMDEAWFGYANFHPRVRAYSAIKAGADYVTHSVHKVLSAFSQASLIHVNDPDFDEHFFREIFYTHLSTSPQYQLIASMDVCAMQMRMEGYKLLNQAVGFADEFRKRLNTKGFGFLKVMEPKDFQAIFPHLANDNVGFDPLKVSIDVSGLLAQGWHMANILDRIRQDARLEVEKYTNSVFLVLFTIGTIYEKAVRLYEVLQTIDQETATRRPKKMPQLASQNMEIPAVELVAGLTPRDAFFSPKRELLALEACENRISAAFVTPTPPGIPTLVPSQRISAEHITFLTQLLEADVEIHGCFEHGKIYVMG